MYNVRTHATRAARRLEARALSHTPRARRMVIYRHAHASWCAYQRVTCGTLTVHDIRALCSLQQHTTHRIVSLQLTKASSS